ncbi:MAG: hypothetical protein ACLGHC_06870 [Alphaproteobacteria bacterium]
MLKFVAFIALLSLPACAPSLGTVSSSGGIVKNYGWTPNQALAIAQKHCEKYGKDAIVTSQNDLQDNMTFQCVAR